SFRAPSTRLPSWAHRRFGRSHAAATTRLPDATKFRREMSTADLVIIFGSLCAGENRRGEVNAKSHGEGVASHIDLESCGATRKGGVEALTEERMGRVFSRVRTNSGTLTL